jgi:NAD(P)-dependent dehydrogenase (short-subunit alcohol dehydrogenase family)
MTEPHVALVTGGARRIGRAIIERLAAEGHAVAIHCNTSRQEADDLADALCGAGARAAVFGADLADPAAVERLVPEVEAALGPVTLLVNNASMFAVDSVTDIDVATWNRQFSVNLRAPSVLAGAMANRLPAGRQGCIINIIDQRVWKLTPQYYSYTLTKSALMTATITMAQAFAPRIRVNGIGPGPTLANIHDGEALMQVEAAGTLLGTSVLPSQITDAVVYLVNASAVTGQMIAVDSGQHLGWQTPDVVS